GKTYGQLLGGNLSMIACLMGTPFLPKLRSSILFLEDVEEAPHRIDRMLAQLFNAGILYELAGLVFGKFTDCNPSNPSEPHLTLDQIQKEYAGKIKCPVVGNFQYGHIPRLLTMPIGLQAMLDTRRNRIEVSESAVI
ncbi:MAG: LD-carboxypeptidase, partial [Bacteroidota bacterium]